MTTEAEAGSRRPLALAVRHINASARHAIGENALLRALTSDVVPPEYEHHVRAFFDEIEVETLSDLVRSGAVTYPVLARKAASHLDTNHDTRRWLDERA